MREPGLLSPPAPFDARRFWRGFIAFALVIIAVYALLFVCMWRTDRRGAAPLGWERDAYLGS